MFRQDRNRDQRRRGRNSGGVAVYLRNDYAVDTEMVLNYSNRVTETLGLYSKSRNLLLIVMYRQPDDVVGGHRSTHMEFRQPLNRIRDLLSTLSDPVPDILLCGDFNLPHAVWPEGAIRTGASQEERIMIGDLVDIAQEFFLFQLITQSTHRRGNMLDLLFSNNPQFLHSHTCVESIFSDHFIMECVTTYNSRQPKDQNEQFEPCSPDNGPGAVFDSLNFFSEETDWDGLNLELRNHDWTSEFRSQDPRDMLHRFINICASVATNHVPTRKRHSHSGNRIPRERRNLMRRRRRITEQLRKTTSEARRKKLKTEAKEIEKKLQKSYRQSQEHSENKAVSAIKKNVKFLYGYAKKFCTVKAGIGPFIDAAQNIISCPQKIAEMLSTQYSSVYSSPKEPMEDANEIFPDSYPTGHWIHNVPFDEEDIIDAIDEIPTTAAAGPDRFPALLLKNCKYSLSKPLFFIWRRSFDTGIIPQLLKTANIIPIHKGKSQAVPANYRPVALTSHLIKLFEKVLRKHIVSYMEENELFNPGQHGFRLGRSCLSQLIAH